LIFVLSYLYGIFSAQVLLEGSAFINFEGI